MRFRFLSFILILTSISISVVGKSYAKQDVWMSSQKRTMLLEALAQDHARSKCDAHCEHMIVEEAHIDLKSGPRVIVVAASKKKGESCHACAPQLSFFMFEKVEDTWSLTTAEYALMEWGAWGEIPEDFLSVRKMGPDSFAIFLESWYGNQGYFGSVVEVLMPLNQTFESVLRYCSSASNTGAVGDDAENAYDWESRNYVELRETTVAKIEVELTDHKNGKHSTSYFTFDGQKFKSEDGDLRLADACT